MSEPTPREQAKSARRAELVVSAARLMARRGFAGVRLEDIGEAAGISGPAMYRHFASKTDLLDQLMLGISEQLQTGGAAVIARGGSPEQVLANLIAFHIDVLVTKPDLIVIHDRDLHSLTPEANHRVRSLQRQYVESWVEVLVAVAAGAGTPMTAGEARVRAHAVFGLLNSSPRLPGYPPEQLRSLLAAMAEAALTCPA